MRTTSRCPKCSGWLFVDRDADGLVPGAPELACLLCGWRRVLTLTEAGASAPNASHQPRMAGGRRRR